MPTVTLPVGDDIGTEDLVALITDAVSPDIRIAKGIDCLKGILVRTESRPEGYLAQLDDDFISDLRKLMPRLPPAYFGMPIVELDRFIAEYRKISSRPLLEPVFNSEDDIFANYATRGELRRRRRLDLQAAINAGEIHAFDEFNMPVKSIYRGVRIRIEEARAYLEKVGLHHASFSLIHTEANIPKASVENKSKKPRYSEAFKEEVRAFEKAHGRSATRSKYRLSWGTLLNWCGLTDLGDRRCATTAEQRDRASPFGALRKQAEKKADLLPRSRKKS